MANYTGTTGPDRYTGTAGADQIDGGAGSDYLDGAGGDDLIDGGADSDEIDGGAGTDIVHGGEGNDLLKVSGSSSITLENDQLFGDGGDDTLEMYLTAAGTDIVRLDGGDGNDHIYFNSWYALQNATIAGGDGNDAVDVIGGGTINVDLGAGDDRLSFNFNAASATYSIALGAGADLLIVRRSGSGAPTMNNPLHVTDFAAGAGGDRLGFDNYLDVPPAGDWTVNPFAAGYLALVQRGSDAVLRLDYDGGGDGFADFIVFEGVSAASLTAYNIGYAPDGGATPGIPQDGDDSSNYLLGSGGSERLRGFGGHDEIFGGAGADRLEGGDGNDALDGGLGDDVLLGEAGDDNLTDRYGGNEQMFGGDGYDNLNVERSGSQAASTVLLDGGAWYDTLRFVRAFAGGFIDTVTVIGGADGDSISVSGAKVATIDAGDGDDNVTVYNVVYQGLTTDYSITLGAGQDRLSLAAVGSLENGIVTVTDFATGSLGDRIDVDSYLRQALTGWDPRTNPYETGHLRLIQRGSDSVLQIDRDGAGAARAFTDLIVFSNTSAAAFNTINLGGYSSITGTEQGERLDGDSGRNAMYGLGGNDILLGYDEADTLYGGAGDDRLEGGGGADKLDGGAGADTMIGGSGNDIYLVDDSGDQVIEDPPYSAEYYYPEYEYDEVLTSLAAYTMPANVERLTGTSASGQILTGSAGYDVIQGGSGNDLIYLLDGRNSGSGGAGDDRIEGGSGVDSLSGGAGSDVLLGFAGDDYLDAGYPLPGTDGTSAVDRLEGGEGNDQLRGNRGNDVLLGGAGNDVLEDVEGGADLLDGGDGDDRLSLHNFYGVPPATRTAVGGAGNDVAQVGTLVGETVEIDLGVGDDRVYFYTTFLGAANVTLGAGRDSIEFSDYSASFHAGSSVTVADFAAGPGGDTVLLKAFLTAWLTNWDKVTNPFLTGHVRLVQSGSSTLLQLDRDGGGDDFTTRVTLANTNAAELRPENLDGLAPAAVFGTGAGDTIRGSAGDDRLDSGDGNDILQLWVGGGGDTVLAGAGNDLIFFGSTLDPTDSVDGGEGTDTLILQGNGVLTLTANVTNIENISILAGTNTNVGAPGTELYDYVITTNDANFAAGLQVRVNAGALLPGEDFTFDGRAETDASFVIYGGRGVDTLLGGLGNDIFFFAEKLQFAPGDTVNGGAGYDSVYFRGNYTIDFNAPGYAGQFNSIESITLTSASDTRYARGGPSEFDYNVKLADANLASGVTLTINGTLLQSFETMVVDGSLETDGPLRIFAGASGDILKGGGQADLIHGNLGADTLTGGGGADTFRYQKTGESTATSLDHILDFTPGTDKIELTRIDADTFADGNQAFHWIGANAFGGTGAGSAGELRAYQSNGTWFVEGDANGDGSADLVIALTLQGGTPLSQADFYL
ncbi:MAG: beta strand repeat-containing protein [Allosphingosinicella sp.]